MTKRPGTQSGEDRDAQARKRSRTPRDGTPVTRPDENFTPVRHILDLIETDHPELAPVIQAIWAHVANVEMRANARVGDESAFEAINRRVDEQQDQLELNDRQLEDIRSAHSDFREDMARALTDLAGKDGTNGKVGTIRASLEKLHSRLWWGITAVVGSVGSVAVKLVIVGKTYGEMEAQIEANRAQLQLLQSLVYRQSQSQGKPQ